MFTAKYHYKTNKLASSETQVMFRMEELSLEKHVNSYIILTFHGVSSNLQGLRHWANNPLVKEFNISTQARVFFWCFFTLSKYTKMIFSTIRTENTLSRCSPPHTEDTTSHHLHINKTGWSETQTEIRTQYWRFKNIRKQRHLKSSHEMIFVL